MNPILNADDETMEANAGKVEAYAEGEARLARSTLPSHAVQLIREVSTFKQMRRPKRLRKARRARVILCLATFQDVRLISRALCLGSPILLADGTFNSDFSS